jgi:hypothetical protein
MTFRNIMILIALAVAVPALVGIFSHDPKIREMAFLSLIDDGKVLMGAAIGILIPQVQRPAAVATATQVVEARRTTGQHQTIAAPGKGNP